MHGIGPLEPRDVPHDYAIVLQKLRDAGRGNGGGNVCAGKKQEGQAIQRSHPSSSVPPISPAARMPPSPSARPRRVALPGRPPAPPCRPARRPGRVPPDLLQAPSRYCLPPISYITGEPMKLPPNRDDQSCLPVSLSQARMWLSRPAPKTSPDSVTMMPLLVAGAPVPVMPRAASAGSSPKAMRHLMAGCVQVVLHDRRERRLDAIGDRVVFVDRVARRIAARPPDTAARAAAAPARASGRVHDRSRSGDQLRRRAGSGRRATAPREPPAPRRAPRPPARAVRNVTRLSTSAAVRCGNAGMRPLPAARTARIAARIEARRAGGDVVGRIGGRVHERHAVAGAQAIGAVARLAILLIDQPAPAARGAHRRRRALSPGRSSRRMPGLSCATT